MRRRARSQYGKQRTAKETQITMQRAQPNTPKASDRARGSAFGIAHASSLGIAPASSSGYVPLLQMKPRHGSATPAQWTCVLGCATEVYCEGLLRFCILGARTQRGMACAIPNDMACAIPNGRRGKRQPSEAELWRWGCAALGCVQ